MLEGLEATEVTFKTALGIPDFRVDAEFFQKMPPESRHLKWAPIGQFLLRSQYGISIEMNEDGNGVPIYRMNEIKQMLCIENIAKCAAISSQEAEPFILQSRDVIFNRTNSQHFVGRTGLFLPFDNEPRIFASYLVRFVPDERFVLPEYLVCFLNSRRGKRDIKRRARISINQSNVNPEEVKAVRIPLLSMSLQKLIADSFSLAHKQVQNSKQMELCAEQTLLRALGLENWQPPEALSYTRKASDAFKAGRLDAEFFYPGKKAALDFLKTIPSQTIGEMFHPIRKLWHPTKASIKDKVRNYDLTDALQPFLDETKQPTTCEEIKSTKKQIRAGDIVISRLRSYLKEISVVLDTGDIPMVGSTEFIVLRPKRQSIRVEALLVYLRSHLPQLILKWSQDGSNHPRFDEKILLSLRVPEIVIEHQDKLAQMVKTAIEMKKHSKTLLEAAKHAVEIAIEQSEEAALEFLESQQITRN